jgi:hypothetical protein
MTLALGFDSSCDSGCYPGRAPVSTSWPTLKFRSVPPRARSGGRGEDISTTSATLPCAGSTVSFRRVAGVGDPKRTDRRDSRGLRLGESVDGRHRRTSRPAWTLRYRRASSQAAAIGSTSRLSRRPDSCSSFHRSYATCRLSQLRGSTRKYRPRRAAVSGVIDRRPARISLRWLYGMPVALAAASWVIAIGSKNSVRRMIPGWMRRAVDFMGSSLDSVIIDDLNLFGVGTTGSNPKQRSVLTAKPPSPLRRDRDGLSGSGPGEELAELPSGWRCRCVGAHSPAWVPTRGRGTNVRGGTSATSPPAIARPGRSYTGSGSRTGDARATPFLRGRRPRLQAGPCPGRKDQAGLLPALCSAAVRPQSPTEVPRLRNGTFLRGWSRPRR